MAWHILIIDDEETMCRFLEKKLTKEGHKVTVHTDPRRGEAALARGDYDAVITDLVMPEMNGMDIVRAARALTPPPQVIVMTAYGTIETAVAAMKHGAFDYITKPFTPDEILIVLERAIQNTRLAARVAELEQELSRAGLGEVIGRSAGLRKALEQVERFAAVDGVVLITGETGTGKEVIARALHRRSTRATGPFIAVNCAAIPENLLEAELFGCKRGAFTGADRDRRGLVLQATDGTLLLDEIGDASASFQVSLLRFIETRKFRPVGGEEEHTANARIVVATHRDLRRLVTAGRFREDLFYRVNALTIPLPPLRFRQDDIPLLASHFLAKYAAAYQRPLRGFKPEAMQAMLAHAWPGNVRELEKAVERAVAVCTEDWIGTADLALEFSPGETGATAAGVDSDYSAARARFEGAYFSNLLRQLDGNIAAVARTSGLDYSTVQRKLKKYLPDN